MRCLFRGTPLRHAPLSYTSPRHASPHYALLRHAPAKALLLLALVVAHANPAAAQATATRGAASVATGTVSGRVTTSDGKPVVNINVALMPADNAPESKATGRATTDADGRYRIPNVPAGRYRLQTLAPVYVSPEDRSAGFFNGGKIVTVGVNETVEDIDVTLVRGGVITGRVTNAEGKPVIAERVTITNANQPNARGAGAWVVSPYEFETDDRGIYRVYGVPPGRYLVSVGQDRDGGMVIVGPAPAQYARTFHPNAPDAAQAKPVEVAAGGEAANVDISIADAPKSYEARGKIVDESGNPVAGIRYGQGALRGDARAVGAWGSDGSATNADGEFVVRNLMPGRYAVFAIENFSANALDVYSDAVQFEITDSNVSGLIVKVHRGASLSGTVTIEGTTDRAVLSRITEIAIYANVRPAPGATVAAGEVSAPSFVSVRVNADGTFRLKGLRPGRLVINFQNFNSNARGFMLLGIQRGGADASAGIDVTEGEQVTGVRVRLGYGTGVVRGQIDLRDGGQSVVLPEGVRMTVVARRVAAGGTSPSPTVTGSEVDSRGRFVLEGLIGGEYELMVNAYMMRPQSGAAPVRRFVPVRQTIVITDGGETNVTITYDLSKQPDQNP
jgi:hypothetical protein